MIKKYRHFLGYKKRVFYMSKLSYEDKINIYQKKKQGQSRYSFAREYSIKDGNIFYIVS